MAFPLTYIVRFIWLICYAYSRNSVRTEYTDTLNFVFGKFRKCTPIIADFHICSYLTLVSVVSNLPGCVSLLLEPWMINIGYLGNSGIFGSMCFILPLLVTRFAIQRAILFGTGLNLRVRQKCQDIGERRAVFLLFKHNSTVAQQ